MFQGVYAPRKRQERKDFKNKIKKQKLVEINKRSLLLYQANFLAINNLSCNFAVTF